MITIELLTLIDAPIERVFDLSLSIEVHLLGSKNSGEQAIANGSIHTGLMRLGDRVTWQARHFGVLQRLTSEITRYDRPHAFQDTMVRGAFQSMQHDHFFRVAPNGATEMRDVFRFAAPLGVLGRIAERVVLRTYMLAFLKERNAVLKQIAESPNYAQYLH